MKKIWYTTLMSNRDFFKGKRIAVIGVGPHGEMVEDIKFMIKAGALVSIYDLKSEARLKNHLVFLRSVGLANYVCGSVPRDDLVDMDMIILSHEYPRDASFLAGVYSLKKDSEGKNIPVEYPETLFFKKSPPVTVIGVMGSCGKSTVVSMLAPMLEDVCSRVLNQGFFVIDPESGSGIISHLGKIKNGDTVLFRGIDSMVKELFAMRISPHVAVFTSLLPKTAYTDSPFEILTYQTHNNFIVASDEIVDVIHSLKIKPKAKMFRTKPSVIPPEWLWNDSREDKMNGWHKHDKDNAALALEVARLFKVTDDAARNMFGRWKSLKGRLEPVKKIKGVEFYNDSASVLPFSTETSVVSMAKGRNIVLIFGGANVVNGENNYKSLYDIISKHVHTVVLLPGSGTVRERRNLEKIKDVNFFSAPSLEEAVRISLEHAAKGDKILFSPGFDAAGFDGSRKERGERFVRAVRGL